jgi:hypothetical protein
LPSDLWLLDTVEAAGRYPVRRFDPVKTRS